MVALVLCCAFCNSLPGESDAMGFTTLCLNCSIVPELIHLSWRAMSHHTIIRRDVAATHGSEQPFKQHRSYSDLLRT
jgi:hypothetical protein